MDRGLGDFHWSNRPAEAQEGFLNKLDISIFLYFSLCVGRDRSDFCPDHICCWKRAAFAHTTWFSRKAVAYFPFGDMAMSSFKTPSASA